MSNFRYEFVEYAVDNQNLDQDDIQFLLTAKLVSPVSLVRRVSERDSLPLLSHPDFSEDFVNSKSKVCSENCRRFIDQLQELRKKRKMSDTKDLFTTQPGDRRAPLSNILINFQDVSFLGFVMGRDSKTLTVAMPTMSLKVGHSLELLILNPQRRDRLFGKVKTCVERLDRRNTRRTFYVYDITYF
jgi:hypothetical protein